MAGKKSSMIDPEAVARYRELIAAQPGMELKGAAMPYTSVNGNMSSIIAPVGVLHIRLSKSDKLAFLEKFNARVLRDVREAVSRCGIQARSPNGVTSGASEGKPYFPLGEMRFGEPPLSPFRMSLRNIRNNDRERGCALVNGLPLSNRFTGSSGCSAGTSRSRIEARSPNGVTSGASEGKILFPFGKRGSEKPVLPTRKSSIIALGD